MAHRLPIGVLNLKEQRLRDWLVMHALDLIELANTYVQHAEAQVVLRAAPSRESVNSFWLTCRFRHDYWSGRLASHRAAIQKPGASHRNQQWLDIVPIIQDVLLTEPLTRAIAYHASVMEAEEIDCEFAALAHSTLAAHVEARHRCLHLIVFGSGLPSELASRMNRIRRIAENYLDQLLALMRPVGNMELFSFDALSTAHAQESFRADASSIIARRVHAQALSNWFARESALDVDYRKADPRQTARVAQSVLSMLPHQLFDGVGVPRSPRAAWLHVDSTESDGKQTSTAHISNSPLDLLAAPPRRDSACESLDHRRW